VCHVCMQFEVGCCLVGHTESVTAVDAAYVGTQLLIVSASADCTLRFWLRPDASSSKMLQILPLVMSLVETGYVGMDVGRHVGCR